MSDKALTTIFGGGKVSIADPAALANALKQDVADSGGVGRGSGNLFLNFSGKKGIYSLGQSRDDLDPEVPFAVNVETFTNGWVAWKASKVVKRHRWPVGKKGIPESDLEDIDFPGKSDGWKAERSFICRSLEDGKQVEFSTSSISACNVVADLMVVIAERMASGLQYFPVFGFDKETFVAHEQTNFKPKLNMFAWVSMENLIAFEAGDMELDDLLVADSDDAEPAVKKSKAKEKSEPKKKRRPTL